MFKLIRNGELYTPDKIGMKDILIAGNKIATIAPHGSIPDFPGLEKINAEGKRITPGFVDGHIHLLGAGGGAGPDSRSTAVHLSTLVRAGVTTCIGVLGIDRIGFTQEELLIRARALAEEGLTTYILAGSYTIPPVNITGSVLKDLYLIDKTIGVKTAIFEEISSHPDEKMLKDVIAEVWLGARLGNKAGVIVAHIGEIEGDLMDLVCLMERMRIQRKIFVATHINRTEDRLANAAKCGKRGMTLDLTGNFPTNKFIRASKALKILLDNGVPLSNITFSSDSNAAYSLDGYQGILPVDICKRELKAMVQDENIPLETALSTLTINPAAIYKLDSTKGSIAEGKDADLIFLDETFEIETVIAGGKVMLERGKPIVRGRLEKPLLENLY
jgi:beta-aspartyl-dipeptidase (metallo-type)